MINNTAANEIDFLENAESTKEKKETSTQKVYIESYGCQMNFSDSEIVASILQKEGFQPSQKENNADLILINTCSIREKAEATIKNRLKQLTRLKTDKPSLMIGIMGCMAERLKTQLLEEEKIVDIVVGPDAYRDLPRLISIVKDGHKSINTFLSREETYADIAPIRLHTNGVTAFVSIMRGCDNMCSFCVVPMTRGRERSRQPETIISEIETLFNEGYREVTLLGQNVDSYHWKPSEWKNTTQENVNFAQLLEKVACIHPDMRIRFSTSHPKDITEEVLHTMNKYENICKYIHFPAQSGSTRILKKMNRTYDRVEYLQKIDSIRNILGDTCGISSDFIAGFCSETQEDHIETLSLMKIVKYDFSYMFYYSERPKTLAARKYEDDIPLEVKKKRLQEIIALQQNLSWERNEKCVGKKYKVLVEGYSNKSHQQLRGRNSANKVIVFDGDISLKGSYVWVKINSCTSATLMGEKVS